MLPLSAHRYGAHDVVLPPDRQDRHDAADLPAEVRLDLYRKMQEMRRFEKRAYDLFMRQLVKGTSHLSLGMETIAAGFGAAMRSGDYTFATYRGPRPHPGARGADDSGARRAAGPGERVQWRQGRAGGGRGRDGRR